VHEVRPDAPQLADQLDEGSRVGYRGDRRTQMGDVHGRDARALDDRRELGLLRARSSHQQVLANAVAFRRAVSSVT